MTENLQTAAATPIPTSAPAAGRIPLALKLAYSAFMAVLIPVYWWNYGPTNFLYFCDVALLLTLIGVWRESATLISMAAVGIIAPQLLWVLDFAISLLGGHFTGMTDYMFNADKSQFLRGLSLFHGWLPFLLIFLVWRVGYDRQALKKWTALAWILILFCFTIMPGPRSDAGQIATPVNINYVHGLNDLKAQSWMAPWAWVACEMTALFAVFFLPTHLALKRLCPAAGRLATAD